MSLFSHCLMIRFTGATFPMPKAQPLSIPNNRLATPIAEERVRWIYVSQVDDEEIL